MSQQEICQKLGSLAKRDGIRVAKVAGIKDAIESEVYEDDQKLDVTVDRLLAELEGLHWRSISR